MCASCRFKFARSVGRSVSGGKETGLRPVTSMHWDVSACDTALADTLQACIHTPVTSRDDDVEQTDY